MTPPSMAHVEAKVNNPSQECCLSPSYTSITLQPNQPTPLSLSVSTETTELKNHFFQLEDISKTTQ